MGRVFASEHGPRPVAVKVLHERFIDDPGMRQRLVDEANAMRRVRHRNVARLVDFGVNEDGLPFLAMDRVEGITLGALIQREGRLSLARVRTIGEQILLGLAAIHRQGLLHGDMKSDNILVDAADKVTIIDFGLARDVSVPRNDDDARTLSGTPEYMAPEVIRGGDATFAADLYSVGVILYEMVTGMTPFTGNSAPEVFERHLNDDVVPPSLRAPDRAIPASFESIILRALAKTPVLRHFNADLFATAVSRSLASVATERMPARSRTPTPTQKTDVWPRRRFAIGTNERR